MAKLDLNPDKVELQFLGVEHGRRAIGIGRQEYLPDNQFGLAAVFQNVKRTDYLLINAQTLLENPLLDLPNGSSYLATRILRLAGVCEDELAKATGETIAMTFTVATGKRSVQSLQEVWHAKSARSFRYHLHRQFPPIPDIERLVFGRNQ